MPNSSKNKRLLLALLLVFFLAGGFFVVWQSNTAKAIECTPPSVKGTTPEGTEACCPANQKPATVDGKIICETLEQFAQRTKKSSWIPDPFETLKNVAKAVIEVPAKTVLFVLNSILYLGLYLLTKIIYLAGLLINYVMGPDFNQMTHRNVVQTGWSITRDLANMFFALVLLLMSFATVLQIETYGLKKLLGRLVIAALLINFSLVFAGVIIDFTQVFTNYFLEAAAGNSDLSTQLMKGLAVHQLYNTGKATEVTYWSTVSAGFGGSAIAVSIELILGIIVLAVAAFSLFAFAFFLIVRLVWLWLLLIFAPLAWVSMIVPGKGGALWNKWWEHFLKWTFFAPIYMFFLYLGLMMVQDRAVTQISISNPNANFISFFYNHPEIILNYIILIIIMLGGLYVAQSFGVQGANGVIKLGKGIVGAGLGVGAYWMAKGAKIPGVDWLSKKIGPQRWAQKGGALGAIGKAFQVPGKVKQWVAPKLMPQVWSRALADIKARAQQASFDKPAGEIEDIWESIKKFGGLGTKRMVPAISDEQKEKEIQNLATQIKQKRLANEPGYEWSKTDDMLRQNGLTPGTPEADAFMDNWDLEQAKSLYQTPMKERRVWPIQALSKMVKPDEYFANIKYQNAVAARQNEAQKALRDEAQIVHAFTIAKDPIEREALLRLVASINGMNTLFAKLGKPFEPNAVRKWIKAEFGETAGARVAADISAIASANGNYSMVGMTKWNPQKNRTEFNNDQGQREIARTKALEMETQEFARRVHPDSFFTRNAEGKITTELHDFGRYLVANITGGHIKQVERLQGRTLEALYKATDNIKNLATMNQIKFDDGTSQQLTSLNKKLIDDFINTVKNRYENKS